MNAMIQFLILRRNDGMNVGILMSVNMFDHLMNKA